MNYDRIKKDDRAISNPNTLPATLDSGGLFAPAMTDQLTIKTDQVVFRSDLYPRINHDPATVQKYSDSLDVLPPIEVNQDNVLIDGWHRWTAHKKKHTEEIRVKITETSGDSDLLEKAITSNASHGIQLSTSDKKKYARQIFRDTPQEERGAKKKQLPSIFSVTAKTINSWLSRIEKDEKEERNASALNLYLSGHTQQEIADKLGMARKSVDNVLARLEDLPIPPKPDDFPQDGYANDKDRQSAIESANREAAEFGGDYKPPLYNVWSWKEKSDQTEHFGNSDSQIVDRLLYSYTKPFDLVLDPFGGSGSTLDICRNRFRRCWISDRKPTPETEHFVRKLDVVKELPPLAKRWSEVSLTYLDPPYWKQAQGKYSDDAEDLANMSLDEFHDNLEQVIKRIAAKQKRGVIALIIQPTQWNADGRQFTDHSAEMMRRIKLPLVQRIQAPYESQQCTAQMVDWAKENRQFLVLSREIMVWGCER